MYYLFLTIGLIVFIFLIYLMISNVLFNVACNKKNQAFYKLYAKNSNSGSLETSHVNDKWYSEIPKEDMYIRSVDKYLLHAKYIRTKNAKRIIVLSHGYRSNPYNDFALILPFLVKNGSSILLVEQRATNESEGKYITFGAYEKKDICDWVNFIASEEENKLPIYIYGISMGCSTALLSTGENLSSKVAGIIADCGYQSLESLFYDLLVRWMKLPPNNISKLFDVLAFLKAKFSYNDVNVKRTLSKNRDIPVIFFHGTDDDFVKPINTNINYEACASEKELVWVKGAKHARSYETDKKLYEDKLKSFFRKYDKNEKEKE